ncbi:MAG TPA: hypothetical protein VFB59_02370 [Candidatus Saccharimonadales bacterium]|nr:hypothetical protein [Candidatus Saccharimonadales bacterium]
MAVPELIVHSSITGTGSKDRPRTVTVLAPPVGPFEPDESSYLEVVEAAAPGIDQVAQPEQAEQATASKGERRRRLGNLLLHPISNYIVAQQTKAQERATETGLVLENRVRAAYEESSGEGSWSTLPERQGLVTGTWLHMTPRARRTVTREAREQLWQDMTPQERRKSRILDGVAWCMVGATAAIVVLKPLPGLIGRAAETWAGLFGDAVISVPQPTAGGDYAQGAMGVDAGPDGAQPTNPDQPVFSKEQLTVTNNMGFYQLCNNLGITDPTSQAKLLEKVGPELVDAGIAYRDPSIGGYGLNAFDSFGNPTALTQEQARLLIEQYKSFA